METRSRRNDPAGMRGKIVDAAYMMFTRRGYHSTAMQDVKAAAQVSGGAFAHHFATKKSLAMAVMETRVADAVNAAWCSPVAEARSAIEGIRNAFDAIISELSEKEAISGCPLNNLSIELSSADIELRAASGAIFETWTTVIADKIAAELPAGTGKNTARDLAVLVVAGYSGAMAMAKVSQAVTPLEICRDQLIEFLKARGLRTGP